MLSAHNKLQSWCQAHSTPLADLEPYSDAIHIDVKDLMQQCKRVEEVYISSFIINAPRLHEPCLVLSGVLWLQLLHILKDEKDFSVARDDGDLRVLYKLEKGAANRSALAPVQPLKRQLGAPCRGAMIRIFSLSCGPVALRVACTVGPHRAWEPL